MKHFLKKVVIFHCLLLLFFIVNTVSNYLIFKYSKVPVKKAGIWVVGDSHPQKGFSPTVLGSAENIAKPGEPYVISFWKLKYIFKQRHPDTVIIGFSQHNFSTFNDLKFSDAKWAGTMFERTYLIGHFDELKDITVDEKGYYSMFFKKMCLYPTTRHFEFLGKYANSSKSKLTDTEEAIKRHFYIKDSVADISATCVRYLDSLVNLCRTNGVTPVLIGAPVTKAYYDKIPEKFKVYYEAEKQKRMKEGLMVLDMTTIHYPDKFYLNTDHLNAIGATTFTGQVRKYFATANPTK